MVVVYLHAPLCLLCTLHAPLRDYRDLGRAAVASVGVLLAPASPEASDAAPTRRRTGFFVPPQTEPTACTVVDTRRLQSPAKALQSAPLGPRWSGVARSSISLCEAQLYTRFPAHLRRCCGKKRGASILSSKVLTVLRVLPRRERLITRPGIPSWTRTCVFLQPLPAAASVQSAVVRPRRTVVPRATRRDRRPSHPSKTHPRPRRPKESLSHSP